MSVWNFVSSVSEHREVITSIKIRSREMLEVWTDMEFQSHRRNFNVSTREASWRKWRFLSGVIYWPLFPIGESRKLRIPVKPSPSFNTEKLEFMKVIRIQWKLSKGTFISKIFFSIFKLIKETNSKYNCTIIFIIL